MANIDNRKIEALELLVNMFLSTGQYDQAKKSVRALRVLLNKMQKSQNKKQDNKALSDKDLKPSDEALKDSEDNKSANDRALDLINSGALDNQARRQGHEKIVDIVKLEAVVNYFAQEYELCINLIERYENEHQASDLLKIDFVKAQEKNLKELDSIIELRTMLLLKAKCLYLLGNKEHSRNLLKEKLGWKVN